MNDFHGSPTSGHVPPPGAAFMNGVRWALFAGLSLLAIISIASWAAWRVGEGRVRAASAGAKHRAGAALYRCPMHPNYTSDKPGECPICSMTLELVPSGDGHASHADQPGDVPGLVTVQIPAERTQLIGVRLARVERGALGEGSPLVGFVAPDETRLKRVQLRVAGWVQDVAMNRTGETVRAGQPMLSLYSPELYQSEREYLIALAEGDGGGHGGGAHEAARERLRLMGVPDDEVTRLEQDRKAFSKLALRSPVTGTVLERNVIEGQYVGSDTPLFTVADLSRVWVLVDLYEMDMGRVHVGDRARFVADGLPGRTFEGAIDFIYPTVSSETRTLKARLSLDNRDHTLRPGMYGQVDVASRHGVTPLVVPAEAVVNTGEVSYVFLARGGGKFEPRRVWTGSGDGDRITVLDGLAEGDTVVASASFLIDSESRLKAAIAGLNGGVTTGTGAARPAGGMPPGHTH